MDSPTRPSSRFKFFGAHAAQMAVASRLIVERFDVVHGLLLGSATTHLKHVTDALAEVLFDDVVALPRVGHELSYRHLALGLVVNRPGAPKSLHLPIAPSDSWRIV
jgi:hypothetical protein